MDNGTDVPMSGDPISQSYDSLWHFNSTSADAGFQQGLPPSIGVKKQPPQDVLHGDEAEEELGLARLVSSYTLPHQNSQPGERGRQTACSRVLSRRARDT